MSKDSEREKIRYHDRKSKGICTRCGKKPAKENRTMCESCLDKKNSDRRWVREMCKKTGICQRCRKNEVFGNEKMCPECRVKAYESLMKSRERRQFDSHEWYLNDIKRKKELGLCRSCGRNHVEEGKTYCSKCLEKKRETGKAYRLRMISRNSAKIERNERPSYGLCYKCGKPLDRDGKICKACYSTNHFITDEERGKPKSWLKANDLLFGKRGESPNG